MYQGGGGPFNDVPFNVRYKGDTPPLVHYFNTCDAPSTNTEQKPFVFEGFSMREMTLPRHTCSKPPKELLREP